MINFIYVLIFLLFPNFTYSRTSPNDYIKRDENDYNDEYLNSGYQGNDDSSILNLIQYIVFIGIFVFIWNKKGKKMGIFTAAGYIVTYFALKIIFNVSLFSFTLPIFKMGLIVGLSILGVCAIVIISEKK